MKSKEYFIEFNKLRTGENSFEFCLNSAFFKPYSIEGIIDAEANISLLLNKTETMYDLHFKLEGSILTNCDNCLDEVNIPLKSTFNLLMKISETDDYTDDEIIYITKKLIGYDLSQYLYESFVLSIPQRKLCSQANKECNPMVIDKIGKSNSGHEFGDEITENPLWSELKKKIKNN
ncbi:MAG: DUF177 domain-containing protein [Bacteroidia bacterium]|nr:DUF177 domain-containing protein [Bacteroidia bacterium]MCC7534009.1 DUF177 domain-containing protein [Bacteroidia bacterium]MCZ2141343.1 DUF177 domain-containing protein [Bacteroidia bacterium]